jgi:aryl-alcohol dehydrogenase-like predicted oxidoreductase
MVPRRLGSTPFHLSPIGFGAFKIGRNEKIKYDRPYDLPDEAQVEQLLNGVLDLGINYIDTAPAYGLSEQRIGRLLSVRNDEFIVSTKVGETFEAGESTYDFSEKAIRYSVQRSRERLQRDVLDIVFIHSDGRDMEILERTDAVATLHALRDEGVVRAIGFSGKTVDGAHCALNWADAIMVEYHMHDRSHEAVIAEAAQRGVGVVVKKGLASGRLPAADAIGFVLDNPGVTSLIIGGLNLAHVRSNLRCADVAR